MAEVKKCFQYMKEALAVDRYAHGNVSGPYPRPLGTPSACATG